MDIVKVNPGAEKGFRNHAFLMIGLLVVQYILGMITNLFVQFPQTAQEGQLWAFAWTQLPEAAHIILGLLLFVSALIFVIRAVAKRNRGWMVSSAVGLIAIMTAIYGGVTFIPSQVDPYSLVMALAFIVAFLAYGWGLFAARG
jgi:hypothetical protein